MKTRFTFLAFLVGLLLSLPLLPALAQTNGPNPSTFTNKTRTNGFGSNTVFGVYAVGNTVYAATNGGLSISTDGGTSFSNKTTTNGLGDNNVAGVYAVGNTVYAATNGGLSISTDGGTSFSNKTTTNGLGDNNVAGVYAVGNTVYAATNGGLSISTDGGTSFSNKTRTNGLGDDYVLGVYAVGNTVYAATAGGLSFSVPPPPVVTMQPASASVVCAGALVRVPVTVSDATTYQWLKGNSPVSGQTSATLTLTSVQLSDAGVYSLSATGAGGSVTSNTFTLTVNAPPTNPSLSSSGTITCAQTSVTLTATATGATAYTLTGGATPQTNTTGQFVVSTAGSYTVAAGNANGCAAIATTTVIGNTAPPADARLFNSGQLTCAQTSVTLTAMATGATAYALSDGQTNTTGRFVVGTAGSYTATISNANGCTATATTTVTSNTAAPTVSIRASSAATCAPNAITLTASSSSTNFIFSAGATQIGMTNQAIVTQSGSYSVTALNADGCNDNGCTATASINVIVNQPPAAPTLTNANRQVVQSTTPLLLSQFASATGSNTLSFSGVSGLLNPAQANVSQPGTQNFSVSQTDANGCTSAATPFTITVVPVAPVSQTVCRSSAVVISAVTSGVRYEWFKNGTSAPFKLTEIASIQRGTKTASLTIVSVQTSAPYYCKVFQANGSFTFDGPYQVAVNYGCIAPGARVATAENAPAELPLTITVAPNPVVAESLRAVVRGAGGSLLTVDLVNLQGTVVRTQQWPVADDEQVLEWPVSGRSTGLYLLRARSNGQVSTVKVVKQ